MTEVTDLTTALAAIDEIVEGGEGSSPCNPYNFYEGKAQLSHYFLFKCVAEKHQLRVHLNPPTVAPPKDKKNVKKDGYLSEVRHRPTFKFKVLFVLISTLVMLDRTSSSLKRVGQRVSLERFGPRPSRCKFQLANECVCVCV